MMYTNPVYDDLDVASIQSEKATLVDATITNLIVTGSITYPDSSGNTDSSGFVVESLDVSGNCNIGGTLTCKGNVILGDETTSEGSVIVTNPYLYVGYNSNGVAPSVDADTYPQLYGCITGNMEAGQAEVDFVNLSTDEPYNGSTVSAFNFYKMPSTTPIVKILNNGQIDCSAVDCTGTVTTTDLSVSSSILSNNANIGTSYSYLGFFQAVQLQGSLSPASSGDLSTYTNIFSYSALPPGVYMCLCTLVLTFSAGTSLSGYYVQGVLNGNLATFPFAFYDNYATSFTNTTQITVPCNFMFTNTTSNGTLGIQISCSYGGTFQVLGETTYSQVVRIA
jgi:hypothetical protein